MKKIKSGYTIINGRRVPLDIYYNDKGEFTTDTDDPVDIEIMRKIVNMMMTPRTFP